MRNARTTGTSDTTDMANIEVPVVASMKDRSATGTVYLSGSVR
ncbi:hypothetical protein [Actinophytocola sp.]